MAPLSLVFLSRVPKSSGENSDIRSLNQVFLAVGSNCIRDYFTKVTEISIYTDIGQQVNILRIITNKLKQLQAEYYIIDHYCQTKQ